MICEERERQAAAPSLVRAALAVELVPGSDRAGGQGEAFAVPRPERFNHLPPAVEIIARAVVGARHRQHRVEIVVDGPHLRREGDAREQRDRGADGGRAQRADGGVRLNVSLPAKQVMTVATRRALPP